MFITLSGRGRVITIFYFLFMALKHCSFLLDYGIYAIQSDPGNQ
ncbi:hypothetical protein ADU37_CDS04650 [Thermococcus sp. 2319x1]|nr:hypothetical protein ADU37_CDS04650 [Thermococcus sp. 2319x1]